MAHHDGYEVEATGCCAVGCVVAMAGVLGFLCLCVWVVLPAVARLVAS